MRRFKTSHFFVLILAVAVCLIIGGSRARRAQAQNDAGVFIDSFSTSIDDDNHGFNVANMDRSAAACENFFQYANGGWAKNNPVPAAYSRWGRFDELQDKNREVVHQILEEASKDTKVAKGSGEQKVGDYNTAC